MALSIILIVYVVSIIWCKWAVDIIAKDDDIDYYIFTKEFIINLVSWIPILNLFFAVISTHEIMAANFALWEVKRTVKKKLREIANKHKGKPEFHEINKIIKQL